MDRGGLDRLSGSLCNYSIAQPHNRMCLIHVNKTVGCLCAGCENLAKLNHGGALGGAAAGGFAGNRLTFSDVCHELRPIWQSAHVPFDIACLFLPMVA